MEKYSISELNKVKRGPNRASYNVETINTILDDGFLCNVGYVWEGKAIVIPMAYGRYKDKIYLHGSLKNRMFLSLLQAGEACISVTHLDGLILARSAFHHSANYRSINIFGKVNRIDNTEEKIKALEYVINQMIPDHWDSIRQPNTKELNATLVIEIAIDTASAKIKAEGVVDDPKDFDSSFWAGVVPVKQVVLDPLPDAKLRENTKTPNSVLQYVKKHKI